MVNVSASLPTDRPRSAFINSKAGLVLRAETPRGRSAKIQKVSGATVTSLAYERSLQAARTAAHV